MLEDRDYMRQPVYKEPRISFTVLLLIINAVVFLVQLIASHSIQARDFEDDYFALSLFGLEHFRVWELLTFQFMHAGWMHIIMNSLAIYFFGRSVENVLGVTRFLTLYFTSGIIGGLVQILFTAIGIYDDWPVVGASAGASGLVAAFAVMNWREQFTLLFYFFPVTMRGKTLLWISIAFAVIGIITPNTGVANAAHLGGIISGALFAVLILRNGWHWNLPAFRSEPRELASKPAKRKLWSSSVPKEEDLSAEEFLQTQVDPILEKISAHGIQSLTTREREILEKARSKIEKR